MEKILNLINVKSFYTTILKVVFASLILAVSAQIYIPLYYVNITGQTLAVVLLSLCLPTKMAISTMLLYIFEGLCGLPVFTSHRSGLAILLSPTGGYMIGFVFASAFISYFIKNSKTFLHTFLIVFTGLVIIFACGLLQLSLFVPSNQLLKLGLLVFIPGEIVKMFIASFFYQKYKRSNYV
ncbi:MAG: biotin transporter BioY [Rickettsiales bacterium]|nr:MAG: biotin transporter BioY [Rickettsiales bacterium]